MPKFISLLLGLKNVTEEKLPEFGKSNLKEKNFSDMESSSLQSSQAFIKVSSSYISDKNKIVDKTKEILARVGA